MMKLYVVVGSKNVHLQVSVLRNDCQGTEETKTEVYVERSIQVVYLHVEKE